MKKTEVKTTVGTITIDTGKVLPGKEVAKMNSLAKAAKIAFSKLSDPAVASAEAGIKYTAGAQGEAPDWTVFVEVQYKPQKT